MNKNVLYLSYDGMTDPLGQSQVLPYLVGLSKMGYQISLISFEKMERFSATKELITEICQRAGISWHPEKYTKRPPVLSTIRDIWVMRKAAAALHKKAKFDLIHCRSYIGAMTGLWMGERFNVPYIFDMRGFWADERVDGGLWSLGNPVYKTVYRYFKRKEKQFLNNAAAIVSLTFNAKEELTSRNVHRESLPIFVIPCCVDLTLFNPENITVSEVEALKKDLGIDKSSFVITYVGSIGTWYLLTEMLIFFKKLQERLPSSVLLFVTPDSAEEIVKTAEKLGIDPGTLRVREAKRKEVPLYISVGAYSLFFIKPTYSKKASSPTKQGEIMAMGKPVICNAGIGDTDFVINSYKSGILVDKMTEKSFAATVDKMLVASFTREKIRDGAKEFFSLERGLEKYGQVYDFALNASR